MTNHEAIETLKANYPDACFEQLREAVDTAIFALQRSTHKALDTISRQDAIDVVKHAWAKGLEPTQYIEELPSAQPEITEEQAIEHLQSTGWMQRHDRILTESTWDIIRCRDCKYWREHKYAKETKRYIPFCGFNAIYTKADDFCSRAERKENR